MVSFVCAKRERERKSMCCVVYVCVLVSEWCLRERDRDREREIERETVYICVCCVHV